MEIIYDAIDKIKERSSYVVYEDATPVDERKNPYITGELELMEVDDEYKLDSVTEKAAQFLVHIRGYFWQQRGEFITYQQVLQMARERGFIPADYEFHAHPFITRWMNMLWKAGFVRKYRRGKWLGVKYGKWKDQITGQNHGITYWIWE